MSHVDYAIHSVQAALKLDPKHLGALSAMADFQRKRGSWGELIETLSEDRIGAGGRRRKLSHQLSSSRDHSGRAAMFWAM